MSETTQIAPKAQITTGGPLAALVPQSLDEAFRLAKALSVSGDMVPRHFQDKPEMIMAAVMRGAEIGLMPMQALSNIAVINGRASLWGDALPALMQRAGHHIDVAVTGEGDAMVATATLTRGDTDKVVVRSFSAADAKAAGLWGKAGPWQQYKSRMLSMRARAWACRDGAADALMGLQVAEEVEDYDLPRDITPREPGGFAAKARAARGEIAASPPVEKIDTPQVEDAQVLPHWTEGLAWDEAFPGSDAWDEGVLAFEQGRPSTDCPYDGDQEKAVDWLGGYFGAERAKA
jgi:hypothetical protein